MESKDLVLAVKDAAEDKKAENPVILDIAEISSIAQYFLITHGNSEPQVKAIANSIIDSLSQKGSKPLHVEGLESGKWVLVDFGDVVAHVFYKDTREFYAIERLWGDAETL